MAAVRTSPSLDALVPSWPRRRRAATSRPHRPVLGLRLTAVLTFVSPTWGRAVPPTGSGLSIEPTPAASRRQLRRAGRNRHFSGHGE